MAIDWNKARQAAKQSNKEYQQRLQAYAKQEAAKTASKPAATRAARVQDSQTAKQHEAARKAYGQRLTREAPGSAVSSGRSNIAKTVVSSWETDGQRKLRELARRVTQEHDEAENTRGFGDRVKRALSVAGKNAMGAVGGLNASVASTADFLLPDFLTPQPVQKVLDYYKESGSQFKEAARQENRRVGGQVGEVIGDLSMSALETLPQTALALMTGGSSTTAQAANALANAGRTLTGTQMLTNLIKNPSFGMSAARMIGPEYDQAKADGADALQATLYALAAGMVNAGIEVGSGVETIGQTAPGLRNWARAAGEEGLEEVKQGIVSALGQKGIYASDTPWASLSDDRAVVNPARAAQEFAGGAIVGGLLGAPANLVAAHSARNYDYLSGQDGGRTPDFDAQWNRYNQAGQLGIPIEQVQPYPTATPVGQDVAYGAHAAGMNDYSAAAQDAAQRVLAGETVADGALDKALSHAESRAKLEDAVGQALPEGYAEARQAVRDWQSTQKSAVETSETEQPVRKPGLNRENMPNSVDAQTADAIDRIGRRTGVEVRFDSDIRSAGTYQDGVITIRPDAENPVRQVFVHELTHHLEQSGDYADFVSFYRARMEGSGIRLDKLIEAKQNQYAEKGVALDADAAQREVVAEFCETVLFTDDASIARLAQTKRGIAQRIRDWLHDMAVRLRGTAEEKFILEAEKRYRRALASVDVQKKSAPGGTQYMFSRTQDTSAVKQAEQMEQDGKNRDEIWRETGLIRDAKGNWVQEIDDSTAKFDREGNLRIRQESWYKRLSELEDILFDPEQTGQISGAQMESIESEYNTLVEEHEAEVYDERYLLTDFLHHDALYERYPRLKQTGLQFINGLPEGTKGYYSRRDGTIYLSDHLFGQDQKTLLHEIQHIVQHEDRRPGGASPAYWQAAEPDSDSNALYRNTAGEIEARQTAQRSDMTYDERRFETPDFGWDRAVFAENSEQDMEIDPNYQRNIDRWDKKGKPDGETFILGSTGDVLQGLGAIESDIYMRGDKIKKILYDHPEMTLHEIKKLPEILEDPVLILKSRNTGRTEKANSRVVVFGNVKAQNGQPVLTVLDLRPYENRFLIEDMQKVNSAYTKDRGAASFFERSDIMYADKKRAAALLRRAGFQMPAGLLRYGSMGSIAYENGSVKLDGVPFSEIISAENPERSQFKVDGSNYYDLLRRAGYTEQADALQRASKQYGTYQRGEFAARDVKLPKQMNDETRVRRFARTAAESAVLNDEQAAEIGKMVAEGRFNYEPIGDRGAVARAEARIAADPDQALRDWQAAIDTKRWITKNDIALGELLLKQAAESGDTEAVIRLTAEVAAAGTSAGQVVQAMRLLKQMGGAGQLVSIETIKNRYQKDLDARYGKKAPDLNIPDDLKQALMNATTEDEINAAKEAIFQCIAEQIPSSAGDKWNAWRYLSMLGNPRTHIRNVLGNAMFEPMVATKNLLGAIAEEATDAANKAVRGKGIERTKSLHPVSPEIKAFAKADYAEMKDIVQSGGKYNDAQKIDAYRRIFTGSNPVSRAVEWARKANGRALEFEDGIFLGHHYVNALASYLTANHVDAQTLADKSPDSQKILDHARAYAIREAQRATYRDASQTAEVINLLSRQAPGPVRMVVEGVLPFKKTPLNILKRGIEYSPAGLLKAFYKGVQGARNGKYTANEVIDDFAASLTGTGLLAVGYLATSLGFLTGGGDEEDESKWFRDMLGYQSYALQIGDKSYTLDWAAPGSMPLFVGSELFQLVHGGKLGAGDLLSAMERLTEPMNNMSMLYGLNDTLDHLAYHGDTNNALMNLFTDSVISYFSQAVPTLLGQIARTSDGTRRTTYADKNNQIPDTIEKAVQKAGNKIPFLSKKNPAYINLWGETEATDNPLYRLASNMFSPGYADTVEMDALDKELLRLYDQTGENVFPDSASRYIRVNGETKRFTVDAYQTYAATLGQTSHKMLYDLTSSALYQKAADADKASAVDMVYKYADALAKTGVSDYEMDGWYAKARDAQSVGLSPDMYILYKLALNTVDSEGDGNRSISQSEAAAAIQSMPGLTKKQKAYLWQSQNKAWSPKNNPFA